MSEQQPLGTQPPCGCGQAAHQQAAQGPHPTPAIIPLPVARLFGKGWAQQQRPMPEGFDPSILLQEVKHVSTNTY